MTNLFTDDKHEISDVPAIGTLEKNLRAKAEQDILLARDLLQSFLNPKPQAQKEITSLQGEFDHKLSELTNTIIELFNTETEGSDTLESLSLASHAIDFIKLPARYLSGFARGKEASVTVPHAVRFAYTTIMLSLSILALALPITAVPIGIISVCLGTISAAVLLGRYFLQKEKYLELKNQLVEAEDKMQKLQEEAQLINTHLTENPDQAIDMQRLHQIKEDYDRLSALLSKKDLIKLKIKKYSSEYNPMFLMDRGIGLGLSSLAAAGLICSLFFPPVGIAIAVSAFIAGVAYMGARITMTIVKKILAYRESKLEKNPLSEPEPTVNEASNEHVYGIVSAHEISLVEASEDPHESSARITDLLSGHFTPHAYTTSDKQTQTDSDDDTEGEGEGEGEMDREAEGAAEGENPVTGPHP
jgi:hypothetical protein